MTSSSPTLGPNQAADQHRKLARLVLGLGAGLALLVIAFALFTGRPLLLIGLVIVIPNVIIGVRELRAARTAALS
jgi:hypothetical protein